MTLIRIAILIVLITLNSGCAALTVRTHKKYPKKCTTHYFAPIADTLLIVPPVAALAVLPTAIALSSNSSNSSRDEGMQILVSALTFALVAGFSASHGYSEVSKCRRELKKIR